MKNISKVIILLLGTSVPLFANPIQLTDTVMSARLNTARRLVDANEDLPKAKRILLEIKHAKPDTLNNMQETKDARKFLLKSDREIHILLLEIAHKQNDKHKIIKYSKYLGLPY